MLFTVIVILILVFIGVMIKKYYDEQGNEYERTDLGQGQISRQQEITEDEFWKMIRSLEQDAENGDIQSMIWLGDIYHQGSTYMKPNEEMTLKYWKMAADAGNVDMSFKTALILGNERHERYIDAYYYMEYAADNGNINAQFYMWIYLTQLDELIFFRNEEKGYEYLKAAAEAGQPNALQQIQNYRYQEC